MASVPDVRAWIEAHLPWYDPEHVRERNEQTERIVLDSEDARTQADRVIAAYRLAEAGQYAAAERLLDEVPR